MFAIYLCAFVCLLTIFLILHNFSCKSPRRSASVATNCRHRRAVSHLYKAHKLVAVSSRMCMYNKKFLLLLSHKQVALALYARTRLVARKHTHTHTYIHLFYKQFACAAAVEFQG